jgi:hypothetical protein
MKQSAALDTYWISFPQDPDCPFGIGVTAYSESDAFALVRAQGFDRWYADASEVRVDKGVRLSDLDPRNVAPNIGPMQFRGVWYPAANIGWGAPRDAAFARLDDTRLDGSRLDGSRLDGSRD